MATNNPVWARFPAREALPEFFKALVNSAFPIRKRNHQLLGTEGAQLTGSTRSFQPAVTFLLFDGLLLELAAEIRPERIDPDFNFQAAAPKPIAPRRGWPLP
jgi:hypothetical protein